MKNLATGPAVVLAFVLFGGCRNEASSEKQVPDAPAEVTLPAVVQVAPSAIASATANAAPPEGDPGLSAVEPKRRPRCPLAIPGATGTIANTADGVALTVVAKGEAAAKEIRESARAIALAAGAKNGGGGGDGSGGGGGGGSGGGNGGGGGAGGGMGKCPVVVHATIIDVRDLAGGALVTMRPTSSDGLPALRRKVRERLAEMD